MPSNKLIFDANAILRYILDDIPEQADIVEKTINEILRLALKTFSETSFDFVDCILFANSKQYDIFTFDKKLSGFMQRG